MWTLRHSSGQLIHLLPDTTITIGRKSCDLILEDSSVSHLHAKILIKRNNSHDYDDNDKYSSKCIISNAGSKKRTKIISEKTIYLLPFTNYELQPNDTIHFSSKNEWVVSYKKISLLTCGDCVDQIQNLHKIITSIGGNVFTEWNEDCNFYTTICKRVTPKFVTALAAGLPFVTIKYWEDFYTCCKTRKEFPNPSQYMLKDWNHTNELKNVSLQPETARKQLFDNIEFIFFSNDQIRLYGEIIQLAGGRPLMCAKYGFKDKYLLADNTIVIACDNYQRTSNPCCGLSELDYQKVCRLLAEKKRKMIKEIEIVKAILLCSREKYCYITVPKLNGSKKLKQVKEHQQPLVIEHKKTDKNIIEQDISNQNQQTAVIKRKKIMKDIIKDTPSKNQQPEVIEHNKTIEDIFDQDSPDRNQQHTKKHVERSPTTHVRENKINKKQVAASASVSPTLPEAIVKLEKLSQKLISQFKSSDSRSNVNEKTTKRKRTSESSSISGSRNPSPVTVSLEDDCLITSDSKRKPSNKQLKIVNDQLIPEKIIIKSTNKTKKQKIELEIPPASHLEDDEVPQDLIIGSELDIQADCEVVDAQSDRQSPTAFISDKEDSTTVNNNEEVFQRREEQQPSVEEETPEESISVLNKNLVWEPYDSRKEQTNVKKPIPKSKVPSSTKFTSFFDCYRPRSLYATKKKKETNIKHPIEDYGTKQKKMMINSFLDTENQRLGSSQPNKNSKKLPFFSNSESDDNKIPSFMLKQR